MKLTADEVKNIAKLSRLALTDEQVERFSDQLSGVLEYVGQLNEIDTNNVVETSQVTGLENVYRQDVVQPFNEMEKLVKQAPSHEDGQVKVPNVL